MLKLWFKRVGPSDGNVPPNVEYMYFDHNEWQRQYFAGNVQMIVSHSVDTSSVGLCLFLDQSNQINGVSLVGRVS